jgi:Zn-dependent protease with chaperone function
VESLEGAWKLEGISPRAYQHPADRAATAALQKVPYLDQVVRKPNLYMTQFPFANAFTIGTDKPIVVLNSELVRILDDDGRRVVLAHEAAHVHSDHVLYRTALVILLRLGLSVVRLPLLAGLPLLAIQLALLEWSRAAELSCDRAARPPHPPTSS